MRRVVKPVGKTGRRYLRASARTIVQNPCFVRTANYNFSPSHRYYRHHRSDSLFNAKQRCNVSFGSKYSKYMYNLYEKGKLTSILARIKDASQHLYRPSLRFFRVTENRVNIYIYIPNIFERMADEAKKSALIVSVFERASINGCRGTAVIKPLTLLYRVINLNITTHVSRVSALLIYRSRRFRDVTENAAAKRLFT